MIYFRHDYLLTLVILKDFSVSKQKTRAADEPTVFHVFLNTLSYILLRDLIA